MIKYSQQYNHNVQEEKTRDTLKSLKNCTIISLKGKYHWYHGRPIKN